MTRPQVAAVAATKASKKASMFGTARPMKDIVVQVGGAKAGRRLSINTTINSTAMTFARFVDSLTARMLSWVLECSLVLGSVAFSGDHIDL